MAHLKILFFLTTHFILASNLQANNNIKPYFSGTITAKETAKNSFFHIENKVVYSTTPKAIQRIRYQEHSEFNGVSIFPSKNQVFVFKRDHKLRLFTHMKINEYTQYLRSISKDKKNIHKNAIGVSYYFKFARWEKTQLLKQWGK